MIYEYSRELIENDGWNINNPNRLDEFGERIYLSTEIADSVEGKKFKIHGEESFLYIEYEEELTIDEKLILDTVVYNHKNNI